MSVRYIETRGNCAECYIFFLQLTHHHRVVCLMFTTQLSMQLLWRIILLCLTAPFIHSTSSSPQIRDPSFEENVLRGLSTASKIEPHQGPMRLVRAWNWNSFDPQAQGKIHLWEFTIIELDIYFINSSSQPVCKSIVGGTDPYWGTWPNQSLGPLSPIPNRNQSFDFVSDVWVPQIMAANLARAAGDRGPWHLIQLCIPLEAMGEPHWIFANLRNSITTVGAQTEKVTRNWQPDGVCIARSNLTGI